MRWDAWSEFEQFCYLDIEYPHAWVYFCVKKTFFSHINILFISEYILVLRCLFDREELLSTWFPLFALLKSWEITANERTSVVANIHTNAMMNGVGSKAEEQIYW